MTYTAMNLIQSPAFMKIAIEDAISLIAKINKQSIELTQAAFEMNVPNVRNKVAELVKNAAIHCAKEANAGRICGNK